MDLDAARPHQEDGPLLPPHDTELLGFCLQLRPVVMAGGPKTETQKEVFDFVYDGMQKGAIGVNLGRNIWQTQYPVASIRAIRAIIHEGYNPQEADDLYKQVIAGKA